MVVQVLTLSWLRVIMNHQYAMGSTGGVKATTWGTAKKLYAEGGIRRFYRGVGPALIQGPLSRFGDTAANAGVYALFEANPTLNELPTAVKTLSASFTAGLWRINLMPVDATKTTLQVHGKSGLKILMNKVRTSGFTVLYHGALGAFTASWVGHFPWFFTYNTLQLHVPIPDETYHPLAKYGRNAVIGFCASVVSDTTSNSIRVIKTSKQTATEAISYPNVVRKIIAQDGLRGLFFRGLGTRLLSNGLQGAMFSVLWKYFMEIYAANTN